MGTYQLLPMFRWSTLEQGYWFQLGRRTKWKATLRVGRLSVGGSITVVLETNPTLNSTDWVQVLAFPAISAEGETERTSYKKADPTSSDFVLDATDKWIRARISAITGLVSAEVTLEGKFLDLAETPENMLVTQEIREWDDGGDRLMRQAEADVLHLLICEKSTGILNLNLEEPTVHERIQQEIARQAAHLFRREKLGRSEDPTAMATLRTMSRDAPGLCRNLLPGGGVIWLGR